MIIPTAIIPAGLLFDWLAAFLRNFHHHTANKNIWRNGGKAANGSLFYSGISESISTTFSELPGKNLIHQGFSHSVSNGILQVQTKRFAGAS
jgi:hypothetical protein